MKPMIDWMKAHKALVLCFTLLIFIFPLLIVHILFKWRSGIPWLEAEWLAGDVLGYIAGFEALLGTVILGIVSVYQNDKANATNIRLMEMQEEQRRFQIKEKAAPVDITPIIIDTSKKYYVVSDEGYIDEFDVVNQKYKYFFFTDTPEVNRIRARLFNVVIELENVSDVVLTEIYIDHFRIYDIITNATGIEDKKSDIREYVYADSRDQMARCLVKPHEKIKLCLKFYMDKYDMAEESFHINFDLSTMSIYNVIFSANVTLFRNNVADTMDRVYVTTKNRYFLNMPEAVDEPGSR